MHQRAIVCAVAISVGLLLSTAITAAFAIVALILGLAWLVGKVVD